WIEIGAEHDAYAATAHTRRRMRAIPAETVVAEDLVLGEPVVITGVVVDDARLVVDRAAITVSARDSAYDQGAWTSPIDETLSTRASNDGTFAVRVARGRPLRVAAARDGAEVFVDVVPENDTPALCLVLPRIREVDFRVIDATTRAPIPMFATNIATDGPRALRGLIHTTTIAADPDPRREVGARMTGAGECRVQVRVDRALTLGVHATHYAFGRLEVQAAELLDTAPHVLALMRDTTRRARIRVVDERGAPAVDVGVALFSIKDERGFGVAFPLQCSTTARTGADGIALLPIGGDGQRFAKVVDADLAPARTEWFPTDADGIAVIHELRLAAAASVHGRVTLAGIAVPASVVLFIADDDATVAMLATNDRGEFRSPPLAAGTYRLLPRAALARVPGPTARAFRVAAGEDRECDVELGGDGLGAVRGFVRIRGQRAPGVDVEIGAASYATTATDGSFTIAGIVPGPSIARFRRGGNSIALRELTVREGAWTTLDVDIELVPFRGHVVDGVSGAPVSGARLGLVPLAPGRIGRSDDPFETAPIEVETATDGRWRIDAIEPGPYVVTVRSSGDHPTTTRLLACNANAEDHEIRLGAACSIAVALPAASPGARFALTATRLELPWTDEAVEEVPDEFSERTCEIVGLDAGVWHVRLWSVLPDAPRVLLRDYGAIALSPGTATTLDASR
ncbi:MAG: carboxypeptidase regulatory-like domain-containing protein, partial [Planctomycetes bacterium]|nr:carboxypeptidase regulatory-like domain-containing protein [Planctomycetota bacterium]